MRKPYLSALVVLLAALALTACGSSGSSSGGGSEDEARITTAIENAITKPKPEYCKSLETISFVEQTMHQTGKKALEACEQLGSHGQSETVKVSEISVEGEKARADVAFSGGGFDAQTLEIALVKEGGDWKLDEIVKFAKLDRKPLIGAITKQLAGLPPKIATCIGEGFEKASSSDFEALLLKGESSVVTKLAESCAK